MHEFSKLSLYTVGHTLTHTPSHTLPCWKPMAIQGRIQGFKIEGAQKMSSANHENEARNPFNSFGVYIGPLIGIGSFKGLDALPCYLRLVLKHFDTKLNTKNHSRSKFRGGGGAPVAPPSGSATAIRHAQSPLPIQHHQYTVHGISAGRHSTLAGRLSLLHCPPASVTWLIPRCRT